RSGRRLMWSRSWRAVDAAGSRTIEPSAFPVTAGKPGSFGGECVSGSAWKNLPPDGNDAARASVALGEIVFNTEPITIAGANGLNLFASDPVGSNAIVGTCGTCHDSPNVGNHSTKLPIDIGIAYADAPALDISGLPVFTVRCTDTTCPLKGQVFNVTDWEKR